MQSSGLDSCSSETCGAALNRISASESCSGGVRGVKTASPKTSSPLVGNNCIKVVRRLMEDAESELNGDISSGMKLKRSGSGLLSGRSVPQFSSGFSHTDKSESTGVRGTKKLLGPKSKQVKKILQDERQPASSRRVDDLHTVDKLTTLPSRRSSSACHDSCDEVHKASTRKKLLGPKSKRSSNAPGDHLESVARRADTATKFLKSKSKEVVTSSDDTCDSSTDTTSDTRKLGKVLRAKPARAAVEFSQSMTESEETDDEQVMEPKKFLGPKSKRAAILTTGSDESLLKPAIRPQKPRKMLGPKSKRMENSSRGTAETSPLVEKDLSKPKRLLGPKSKRVGFPLEDAAELVVDTAEAMSKSKKLEERTLKKAADGSEITIESISTKADNSLVTSEDQPSKLRRLIGPKSTRAANLSQYRIEFPLTERRPSEDLNESQSESCRNLSKTKKQTKPKPKKVGNLTENFPEVPSATECKASKPSEDVTDEPSEPKTLSGPKSKRAAELSRYRIDSRPSTAEETADELPKQREISAPTSSRPAKSLDVDEATVKPLKPRKLLGPKSKRASILSRDSDELHLAAEALAAGSVEASDKVNEIQKHETTIESHKPPEGEYESRPAVEPKPKKRLGPKSKRPAKSPDDTVEKSPIEAPRPLDEFDGSVPATDDDAGTGEMPSQVAEVSPQPKKLSVSKPKLAALSSEDTVDPLPVAESVKPFVNEIESAPETAIVKPKPRNLLGPKSKRAANRSRDTAAMPRGESPKSSDETDDLMAETTGATAASSKVAVELPSERMDKPPKHRKLLGPKSKRVAPVLEDAVELPLAKADETAKADPSVPSDETSEAPLETIGESSKREELLGPKFRGIGNTLEDSADTGELHQASATDFEPTEPLSETAAEPSKDEDSPGLDSQATAGAPEFQVSSARERVTSLRETDDPAPERAEGKPKPRKLLGPKSKRIQRLSGDSPKPMLESAVDEINSDMFEESESERAATVPRSESAHVANEKSATVLVPTECDTITTLGTPFVRVRDVMLEPSESKKYLEMECRATSSDADFCESPKRMEKVFGRESSFAAEPSASGVSPDRSMKATRQPASLREPSDRTRIGRRTTKSDQSSSRRPKRPTTSDSEAIDLSEYESPIESESTIENFDYRLLQRPYVSMEKIPVDR